MGSLQLNMIGDGHRAGISELNVLKYSVVQFSFEFDSALGKKSRKSLKEKDHEQKCIASSSFLK